MSERVPSPLPHADPYPRVRSLLLLAVPVLISVALYNALDFDAGEIPKNYAFNVTAVPKHYENVVSALERIGEGSLLGPEDLAYDAQERTIYTGCFDGWIRRVKLDHAEERVVAVEDWAFVGGRPLGVALGTGGELIVANADKGLMVVDRTGKIKLLTEEAEDLKFKLTDAVDVSSDGIIYFTDASWKYDLKNFMYDILELRPHGRLLSFDPRSNGTSVLVRDIYFANGVTVSPNQDFIIFCETIMRRCMRYYIKGDKSGTTDIFVENLPGYPDNIHRNGIRGYWIGLTCVMSWEWALLYKYPFLRNIVHAASKYIDTHFLLRDGGVLEVSLEGKLLSLRTLRGLFMPTGGLTIGRHLYVSLLAKSYMGRLELAPNISMPTQC